PGGARTEPGAPPPPPAGSRPPRPQRIRQASPCWRDPAGVAQSEPVTERLGSGAAVPPGRPPEPPAAGLAGRLNWLRAGVLGANDGIVSVAGIVVGVAGATPARGPVVTPGVAGILAGPTPLGRG